MTKTERIHRKVETLVERKIKKICIENVIQAYAILLPDHIVTSREFPMYTDRVRRVWTDGRLEDQSEETIDALYQLLCIE